jgi:ribosomal protein L11 methyltransferase
VRLTSYFKDLPSLHRAEYILMDLCPSVPLSIAVVKDRDWNAAWKKAMRPVAVAEGIWVSPAWLPPQRRPQDKWIKIEPKMAFGTGHHETTRCAIAALCSIKDRLGPRPRVLDIGTGSGILCFVADCLGAGLMVGIDCDPVCAGNLAENRDANKSNSTVAFCIGTIDVLKRQDFFDCVVMNMISQDALPLLGRIFGLLKKEGHLIWAGLLLEERKFIIKQATGYGFHLLNQGRENEWWCATFMKRPETPRIVPS